MTKITVEVSDKGQLKLLGPADKPDYSDELSVKLMAHEDLEPDAAMELELDVLAYVKKQLASGKMRSLREFLKNNNFPDELKSKIRDLLVEFRSKDANTKS